MLVHRVVVVHVELHHRDDAAERAHEAAEHAGLVHPPQDDLGVVRGEDFEEQPVRLGIVPQLRIDQLERLVRQRAWRRDAAPDCASARGGTSGCRLTGSRANTSLSAMVRRLLSSRKSSLSGSGRRPRGPKLRHHPAQHRSGLGLLVFELRAQDRGEIADVLGDQEVVLHEALDVLHARMLGVAEPHRDLALDVERQPLLGAAGEEMHVAADRPQEILAAAEQLELVLVEHAAVDQLLDVADAIDVLGDPEQRVQVAQAALAVLDVGLDQIARLAGAAVALLALGELGGDELRAGALDHRLVEARHQLVEQLLVAEQEARFQEGGADRHVRLGLADAFVDRARGVADLQSEIPQAIEDRLGDRLAPRGLLVGQQEQQIDVGAGRQQAAAVAAGRHDRHALGLGRIFRRIEMRGDELEQHADDLVHHEAQPLGAAPALAVLQQQLLGLRCGRRPARPSAVAPPRGAAPARTPACSSASLASSATSAGSSNSSSAFVRLVGGEHVGYPDSEARASCHGAAHHAGRNKITPRAAQKGSKFPFCACVRLYFSL